MDYTKLKAGYRISEKQIELSMEDVLLYREATEDNSYEQISDYLVPPTAIAALALKGVIEELAIPKGTIHVGQELEFFDTVLAGQKLTFFANLLQNAVRGESRFLSVELNVTNKLGATVMKGKSTILLPSKFLP